MSMNTQVHRGAFADGYDDCFSGFRAFDDPFHPITESAEFMAWHAGFVAATAEIEADPIANESMLAFHDLQRHADDVEPANKAAYTAGLKAFELGLTAASNPYSRHADFLNHCAFREAICDELATQRNAKRASAAAIVGSRTLSTISLTISH